MVSPLKFNFDSSFLNNTFTAGNTFRAQHERRIPPLLTNGIGGTGIRIANGIGGTGISDGIGGTGIQKPAGIASVVTDIPAFNQWAALKRPPLDLMPLPQANTRAATADDLRQRLNEIQLVQNTWNQGVFKLSFV